MRLELDTIHTPVNEFIDSLPADGEPVELVRDGAVVATLAKKERDCKTRQSRNGTHEKLPKDSASVVARGLEIQKKIWERAAISQPKVTERQAVRESVALVKKARRQLAARAR